MFVNIGGSICAVACIRNVSYHAFGGGIWRLWIEFTDGDRDYRSFETKEDAVAVCNAAWESLKNVRCTPVLPKVEERTVVEKDGGALVPLVAGAALGAALL